MDFGPVVIIPAPYQDLRFPGKPLVSIKGVSILERTYRRACLCPHIAACYIVTDDQRVADHAATFDARCILTPFDSPMIADTIAHVVSQNEDLREAPMIVTVQNDEPCLDPNIISKVIEALVLHPQASVGTAVTAIQSEDDLHNPDVVKCVRTVTGTVLYFSRSVIPYTSSERTANRFRHIGVLSYRPDFLLQFTTLPPTPLQVAEKIEMLRAIEHGYTIVSVEVQKHDPDIHVPEDIEEVERWIENQSFSS